MATPTLLISFNDQPHTLRMPYALLNRLIGIVGGVDGLQALSSDPEIQEAVFIQVFTRRDPATKEIQWAPKGLDDLDSVSLEDIDKILGWVGDHILDFFLRAADKATAQAQNKADKLTHLANIVTGLQDSLLKKPAA